MEIYYSICEHCCCKENPCCKRNGLSECEKDIHFLGYDENGEEVYYYPPDLANTV